MSSRTLINIYISAPPWLYPLNHVWTSMIAHTQLLNPPFFPLSSANTALLLRDVKIATFLMLRLCGSHLLSRWLLRFLVIYRRGSQGSFCLGICVSSESRKTSDYHHQTEKGGKGEQGEKQVASWWWFQTRKNAPTVIGCSTLTAPSLAPAGNSSAILYVHRSAVVLGSEWL